MGKGGRQMCAYSATFLENISIFSLYFWTLGEKREVLYDCFNRKSKRIDRQVVGNNESNKKAIVVSMSLPVHTLSMF